MPLSLLRLRHRHRNRYSLTAPLGAQRNTRVERLRSVRGKAKRKGCLVRTIYGEETRRLKLVRGDEVVAADVALSELEQIVDDLV